jgi:DNA-binding CsgD family transcriptional regulator
MTTKRRAKLDVISLVEACYAPVPDDAAWLTGMCHALAPLDRGYGITGIAYDARDPADLKLPVVVAPGRPESEATALRMHTKTFPPAVVYATYWTPPPVGNLAKMLERMSPTVLPLLRGMARELNMPNAFPVFGADADHRGVVCSLLAPPGDALPPKIVSALRSLSAHLATAYRLRRAVAEATSSAPDAVLDPRGRVLDARDGTQARDARTRLSEAVRRVEVARGRMRRVDPEGALDLWRGLVSGRWSLVDHVESDGKRYVLARRNPPDVPDPKALDTTERHVTAFAVMGRSNKYIGYMLGLAPSTVAHHLARATRKLGVRSRRELVQAFGAAGTASADGPPEGG